MDPASGSVQWWADPLLAGISRSDERLDRFLILRRRLERDGMMPTPPDPILEIPSLDGEISVELAHRGFALTSVEVNADLRLAAERRAKDRKVEISFNAEIPSSADGNEFEMILALHGTALGWLGEHHDHSFLQSMHHLLRPGGSLLVEMHVTETLLPQWRDRDHFVFETVVIDIERHLRRDELTADIYLTVSHAGTTLESESELRLYRLEEAVALFKTSGFRQVSMHKLTSGLFDSRSFGPPFFLAAA